MQDIVAKVEIKNQTNKIFMSAPAGFV